MKLRRVARGAQAPVFTWLHDHFPQEVIVVEHGRAVYKGVHLVVTGGRVVEVIENDVARSLTTAELEWCIQERLPFNPPITIA